MSARRWTVLELLKTTADYLGEKGSASARLDAELLLTHTLATDRVKLYCAFDQPVDDGELAAFRELVRRRAKGEPVAYLLGTKEFYGLDFRVTPDVLIPRPETEHLVDRALECLPTGEAARVLDVGVGSGAVAVAMAKTRPELTLTATDISPEAVAVARENAATHGVDGRVEFVVGDLFAGATGPFDAVVSNPPYVDPATRDSLAADVRDFEPAGALFADENGLAVIRRLVAQAPDVLRRGGALLLETGYDQTESVAAMMKEDGRYGDTVVFRDYAGRPRIVQSRVKG
ncbi:MAG: peptide chain release factor N(5)-glutamine methyltransferase [Deltaproteobacteria bacterium]|nr:peptide chain release factor N(5)-glutamine methyltransferase [Deltaproteobacteria bacterium]